MNKVPNNRAWWLVLPMLALVAFSAIVPLMTVVNYSVQDVFDANTRFFTGTEWFVKMLNDPALQAALARQFAFSLTILAIQVPLGVGIALLMPKRGWRASLVLILVTLPLLIPWNVVGSIWQIFTRGDIGLILQGGLFNTVQRALSMLGLGDAFGGAEIPRLVLNVVHPLVPSEIERFCAGKQAVLVIEEGNPEFIEQQINTILRKADLQTRIHGKDCLPMAGEYRTEVLLDGLAKFLEASGPAGIDTEAALATAARILDHRALGAELIGDGLPTRPPSFCTGCPERPVFSALKILERETGGTHVSADIGCHALATLPPFNVGNTILGYGMGLASSAAVGPNFGKRVISIMGDGGFWHNGLTTGVGSTMFNKNDSILVVMKNGYSSATGWQYLPSSAREVFVKKGSRQRTARP